eukprot:1188712-Prorocentrum_minimum.AAC.1
MCMWHLDVSCKDLENVSLALPTAPHLPLVQERFQNDAPLLSLRLCAVGGTSAPFGCSVLFLMEKLARAAQRSQSRKGLRTFAQFGSSFRREKATALGTATNSVACAVKWQKKARHSHGMSRSNSSVSNTSSKARTAAIPSKPSTPKTSKFKAAA